ncbi:conserved hypothetical protein [Gammaproteobacteria bacterium]
MNRPKTKKGYQELIEQAIFEAQDLRTTDEWELEEGNIDFHFVDPLISQLKQLLEKVSNDRQAFGEEDLPWLLIVRRHATKIPFKDLLHTIHQTYRLGLDS